MDCKSIYQRITGYEPYFEQEEVMNQLFCLKPDEPILIRLPCGYGKTESVVIPFLSQFQNEKWSISPRLIYVLPTRALCNQICDRIKKYADKISQRIVVNIEHGNLSQDPLFFSDICVTTFDQFLYGYARSKPQVGRHLDLPAGAIAHSLVVFDEAHLYSPYTHALLRAMLEILVVARVPVVVMTATMPKSLENCLLQNSTLVEFQGIWPKSLQNRIIEYRLEDQWRILDNDKPSAGLQQLLEKRKHQKILIVVNRVDIAQTLARDLNRFSPILIHSRFTVEDRKEKENQIIQLLSRNSNTSAVVISTQVCEVGLDISCDLLITECASADALVQRVGRVARWGGNGEVVIVKPDEPWPYYDPRLEKNETDDPSDESKNKSPKKQKREIKERKQIHPEADLTQITWDYLKDHPEFIFTDWSALTEFCNQMPYHTDEVSARGALGQLFDSTLYADERPDNLSARGDLYCTVAVLEDFINAEYEFIKKVSINVPFKWFRKAIGEQKIKKLDFKDSKWIDVKGPIPFQIFGLLKTKYYTDVGLQFAKPDSKSDIVVEEKEICLIF